MSGVLVGRAGADDVVIRGARVLDPTEGVDEVMDVRVDGGTISHLGAGLAANGHRVIDADGLVLAPAFIDPHVHLRTPGREDEETIASGTLAAAAGGYCAVLAVPNTDPVLDSTDMLRGLRARAAEEAEVPVGFMAAISVGQQGMQLTEMGELADAGAAAFSDDGRPVASAGLMRRALEYNAITGRPLALHCEEQSLTRGGHMHMGAVSAELGLGGWPSLGESLGVSRELSLAADTGQPVHLMHLSARESVELLRRAQEAGVHASAEVTPHHLCLTDEAVRTLDANFKMNPPLRPESDRLTLIDALRDGTIAAVATDHAPHSREEKDVPFEGAPFGVTGLETAFAALYTTLVQPGVIPLEVLLERMSAGPARIFGLDRPRISVGARGEPRSPEHRVDLAGERRLVLFALDQLVAARTPPAGQSHADDGGRAGRVRNVSAFLVLEDGTVFRGESVAAEGPAFGEAIFTTAMTGYQEVVTDPSYAGQIVAFTAPMVGNYGVAEARSESDRPHACAVVMREARGPEWTDWLSRHGVPALTGIDTRALVLHLRERGAMRAAVVSGDGDVDDMLERRSPAAIDDGRGARWARFDTRAIRPQR